MKRAFDDVLALGEDRGIGACGLLAGWIEGYRTEYPCHAPDQDRWFAMRVAPWEGAGTSGAVVVHQDITIRWLAARSLSTLCCLTPRTQR